MTEAELRAIDDDLRVITPGPWRTSKSGCSVKAQGGDDKVIVCRSPAEAFTGDGWEAWWSDANFIADAPERVAALLAEVRLLSRLLGDRLALDSPEVAALVERAVKEEQDRCAAVARRMAERTGGLPQMHTHWLDQGSWCEIDVAPFRREGAAAVLAEIENVPMTEGERG